MQLNVKDYIISGTVDFIVVHAESKYETELTITGENGKALNLEIDGELEEKKYRCWGTVVAIPRRITGEMVMFADGDRPVRMNEIRMDVNVGEKIYFEYLGLSEGMELFDAPDYFRIPYNAVFCVIRNGEIIPVGSHVFCELVYPENTVKLDDGKMAQINSIGLVEKLNIKPKPFEVIVKHIGAPLIGYEREVSEGQKVLLDRYAWGVFTNKDGWKHAIRYVIEGEDYLVCRQKDISCVFNPV